MGLGSSSYHYFGWQLLHCLYIEDSIRENLNDRILL